MTPPGLTFSPSREIVSVPFMAANHSSRRHLLRLSAAASLLLLAACGSSNGGAGSGTDSGLDGTSPGSDAGGDVATSGDDSSADAGSDATASHPDSGSDAMVAAESGADTGSPPADASMLDAAGDASIDSGPVCTSSTGAVFAMSQMAFGDGNAGQWKAYGFNIDGQVWASGATNHCQPNSGADPATVFPNGNNGVDNSFGHNVLPLLLSIDPTLVTDANNAITNGTFSMLLEMVCLPSTGDAPSLLTKLFDATSLGSMPKWDGTDAWPVAPELLSNPSDAQSSTVTFDMSSVTGSLFDSRKDQTLVLAVPIATTPSATWMTFDMQAAEITLPLSANRTSATGGMIGGVLKTSDFVNQIKMLGSALGACSQSYFPNVITAIEQASDIMSDGTQDPTQTCDGISIGLGLDMLEAQIGGVGPAKATQMACP